MEIEADSDEEAAQLVMERADAGDYDDWFLEQLDEGSGITSEEIDVYDAVLVEEGVPA